mgnify:CR=1 FL=1
MAKIQNVRGTYDLYGEAKRKTKKVIATGGEIVEKYGFEEIETPIFEFTEVFSRNLGDTSDIVTKEMYCFQDRGGESLTLRPEGTAGVVRSFISEGMQQNLPVKLYYAGPMFRYERPQKGRQRQFTQFGVELLGVENPQADIEVISMAYEFVEKLGLAGSVTVEINSLGDQESRDAYRTKLVAYLQEHYDELSEDSKARLEKNPLRVLDSKEDCDKKVVENAPLYKDSLNEASTSFFNQVLTGLDKLGIKYRVNNRLVRGLDYYSHTVFELVTDKLGAQGTVLAGGRYDGLVEEIGGPSIPAVGFGMGIERVLMLLDNLAEGECKLQIEDETPQVFVACLNKELSLKAFTLMESFRQAGLRSDMDHQGRSLKAQFKYADKLGAQYVAVLGDDEVAKGVVKLRNMQTRDEWESPLKTAPEDLKAHLEK